MKSPVDRGAAASRRTAPSAMLETVAREVTSFVRDGNLHFQRGESLGYFRKMARIAAGLTLPLVASEHIERAILLKVLYSLWNVVVDDEIDRQGATTGLDASIAYLVGFEPIRGADACGATVVLDRMAQLVPGGRISRADTLGFDLWEVVGGLSYEVFINRNPRLATPLEYRRHSIVTASVKVHLDTDCLFAAVPPDPRTYRTLREAYDELGAAVKLAGDIGTLRREVHDEDNLNLPRILADRAGEPSSDDDESLIDAALGHRREVEAFARAHLGRAVELISSVPELDASDVIGTVSGIVEVYLSGVDPFFGSGGEAGVDG